MTKSEKIRKLYDGECPDCGDTIPPTMVDGGECENCGHVFYAELLENDDSKGDDFKKAFAFLRSHRHRRQHVKR